jgi:hypothetical protein
VPSITQVLQQVLLLAFPLKFYYQKAKNGFSQQGGPANNFEIVVTKW